MSTATIEKRLDDLTKRVEALESQERFAVKPTWRRAFGAMKDDALLREAARLGAEWRAQENLRG